MGLKRFILGMLLEIRPPVAVPVVLAALLGGAMAGVRDWGLMLLFMASSFLALFVAHVKDSMIDFWVRREMELGYRSRFGDSGGVLRKEEMALCLGAAAGFFFSIMVYLVLTTTWLLLPIMSAGFVLALTYVPYFDKTVAKNIFWPLGVIIAIWGGFVVQYHALALEPILVGAVVFIVLSFGGILDDLPDADVDKKLGKRTIPVILGIEKANRIAYAGIYLGMALGIALSFSGLILRWLSVPLLIVVPIVACSMRMPIRRRVMVAIMAAFVVLLAAIVLYLLS